MVLTSIDDARTAAARVGDRVTRTALVPAPALSRRLDAEVWLKRELDQPTGSFKVRGVFNAVLSLPEEDLRRGLAAFSAGNHAAAVAHVGATLGVPVTVCMPAAAVPRKIAATRALGAEVVLVETDLVGTCQRLVAERGLTLVHPFDHPAIVAGHATAGLEIVADLPTVEVVEGRVETALQRRRVTGPVDLVVLDPPRAGAGARVVRGIAGARPRAVAYVACDPAALARDVGTFLGLGWRLTELRAFDCFPMTQHVECVALLEPDEA